MVWTDVFRKTGGRDAFFSLARGQEHLRNATVEKATTQMNNGVFACICRVFLRIRRKLLCKKTRFSPPKGIEPRE